MLLHSKKPLFQLRFRKAANVFGSDPWNLHSAKQYLLDWVDRSERAVLDELEPFQWIWNDQKVDLRRASPAGPFSQWVIFVLVSCFGACCRGLVSLLLQRLRWEQYAPGPVRLVSAAAEADADRVAVTARDNARRRRRAAAAVPEPAAAAAPPPPPPEGPAAAPAPREPEPPVAVPNPEAGAVPRQLGCGKCRYSAIGCRQCRRPDYVPRGGGRGRANAVAAPAPPLAPEAAGAAKGDGRGRRGRGGGRAGGGRGGRRGGQ